MSPASRFAMDPSRQRFVQGPTLRGVTAGVGLQHTANVRAAGRADASTGALNLSVLSVIDVALDIAEMRRLVTIISGTVPGPVLRWKEDGTVTLRVANHLRVPTSIHWNGILLRFQMEGAPGISFEGIAPGETFVSRFPMRQPDTYWHHSHSGYQEQTSLYDPPVIEPAGAERYPCDRDYVVMLNNWSDGSPDHIYSALKWQSDYYTSADRRRRLSSTRCVPRACRKRWSNGVCGSPCASPADLSDMSTYAYIYLIRASGQLARAVQARRKNLPALHQCLVDDVFRRKDSRSDDDRDRRRRSGCRIGAGGRIPAMHMPTVNTHSTSSLLLVFDSGF